MFNRPGRRRMKSGPLTILSVAYPLAPVGPDSVGGAEQVVSAVDRLLHTLGHRSIVVAQQGSAVSGVLYGVPRPIGMLTDTAREAAQAATRNAIAAVMRTTDIDLIHLHGIDFDQYL